MLSTIESAIEALKEGKLALVVDDFDRENEGDFIGIAKTVTKESVILMLKYTTGIICTPITQTLADQLQLPLMVPENNDPYRTAFTVTIDYRHGTSTGVSAADRAATIKHLTDDVVDPQNFSRPGHVFPLLYREGGVLVRSGHTEAGIDLSRLAEAGDVSYLCEVYNHSTGEMYRLPALQSLAKELQLPLISIADLQRYRYRREILVQTVAPTIHNPNTNEAINTHLPSEITKILSPALSSSSSSSTTNDISTASTTTVWFRSLYYDGQYYRCTINYPRIRQSTSSTRSNSDEEQEEIGQAKIVPSVVTNPSTVTNPTTSTGKKNQSIPRLHVHFDDIVKNSVCTHCPNKSTTNDNDDDDEEISDLVSTSSSNNIALSSSLSSVPSVCITVFGKPYDNVKGKEMSHLDPVEQENIKQQKLLANIHSVPQPTAYTDLFPLPSDTPTALTKSTFSLHTISDRTTAELGQVIRACLRAYNQRSTNIPSLASSNESSIKITEKDIHIEPILTDKTVTTDPLNKIYGNEAWPSAILRIETGQPIPRLWEYGIRIENYEYIS